MTVTGDGSEAPEAAHATVCFADVVGFTRLTRVLAESELTSLVEGFETGAADLIAAHGGRLVKTLGDEVMFMSDDADDAVAVATALHDVMAQISQEARLRVGVATGPIIARMGDVYGSTVNRASRLTALARPGGTVIDPQTEDALTRAGALRPAPPAAPPATRAGHDPVDDRDTPGGTTRVSPGVKSQGR